MSIQVDLIDETIQVNLIEDEVVSVNVQEGITISNNDTKVADTNRLDFLAGDNVTLSVVDRGTNVRVTINSTASGGGSGDVVGPASAVDSNFAAFDSTTGKLLKDSGSSASTFATAAQGALADSALQSGDNISELTNNSGYITSVEGTAVLSTGETGGTKFLREDGDGTCSWQTVSSGSRILIYKDTTVDQSVTGTTSETTALSVLVSAGTILANDVIVISLFIEKSGTAGTLVSRLRLNTTSTGGAEFINLSTVSSINNIRAYREFFMRGTLSSQLRPALTNTIYIDYLANTFGTTTSSIDFSVDQYFNFSFALSNSADTATLRAVWIEVIR